MKLNKKLSKDFDVRSYTFGSGLEKNDSLDFEDKTTDLTKALKQLMAENINQHLGGVILVSDGIYNSGMNPL